ncbi:hypothetical protein B0H12DRAFT_751272 [Mycena haematopus]|nr:hypothetical protein B0H12DRAFT_751272 [Mycena haematopus]
MQSAIDMVVKLVEDSNVDVRRAAISCLSSLGGQGFQSDIRAAIPGVVKSLEDSDDDVRQAAISCLSSLGGQGAKIFPSVPSALCTIEASSQPPFRTRSEQQFLGL